MLTRFSVPPLHTMTKTLAAVAMARANPDLVITGARVLSTYTERVQREREVWVKGGRIAAVQPAGTYKHARIAGSTAKVYDARGGIVAPGLVDPHVHIESSMMTACAFAEAALLNGTTTVFCDSHEIGNVCDVAGIEWMLEDARQAPLSIYLTVPSTVPATNARLETAGGNLTPAKIGRVFDRWPEAAALGEKMDYISVAMGDSRSHAILAEALRRGRPVCGHIYGREFVAAGAASGVTDTHEAIEREIANDFLENGLWLFLRGGSPHGPWHSLPQAIKAVTELGANPKRVCVCTDDRDADDLFMFGMDWVVRQAVAAGLRTTTAWSLGSLHPATRYALDGEFGGMGPGRRADLVLLNDALEVQSTWFGGELVVERRRITPLLDRTLSRRYRYPRKAYETVKFGRVTLTPKLPAEAVTANVIRVVPGGLLTQHDRIEIPAGANWNEVMARHDLCYLAVIERHGKNGGVGQGLLGGFGLKRGAVACSVGHDAHNVVVGGTNESDMQLAAATIQRLRGGVCAVRDSQVLASVALPIAGLLSDKRAPAVAKETTALKRVWTKLGCKLPYVGFNFLPLSVIPELRLTDKGLVDVVRMAIVPLFQALTRSAERGRG